MSETLVKVENLSKKFTRNLKRSMLYGAIDVTVGMLGFTPNNKLLRIKLQHQISDHQTPVFQHP